MVVTLASFSLLMVKPICSGQEVPESNDTIKSTFPVLKNIGITIFAVVSLTMIAVILSVGLEKRDENVYLTLELDTQPAAAVSASTSPPHCDTLSTSTVPITQASFCYRTLPCLTSLTPGTA